ncbi:MAG: hypothetical protein A3J48_00875 [Candidatus Doudnabacteria bacterium RIFCSPHIGHO2_02_FULL_46_11]|uniref:Peptidase M24 domain-containing protein n=1 Tax=Candidatus Doudnabacteria bacterium RIFCSPHIGHO2_02_FULL_46_11 TaxID=1817832 RepID=A0A1F5P893_9BACT|nr:MAG: hypothetical protein A3J48_00875 [Candidatus Doudnabacteria bacterium RIFCSPHIGHO2_02_FULL_46_11]
MNWSRLQINHHIKAAKLLAIINAEILNFIKNNPATSELQVQNFALNKLKQHKLKNEIAKPIIAFRENTSEVHYFPTPKTNKKLKPGSLILIDIWARLNISGAPYADMTWMAQAKSSKSKLQTSKFKNHANTVFEARDKCLIHLKRELRNDRIPSGYELDAVARNFIDRAGYAGRFLHGTGHELGVSSPHGLGRKINPKNEYPIKINMGYTIEPGIYLDKELGARTEIDFYIDKNKKLVITTPVQKTLTII